MIESDADREAMMRSLGGVTIAVPRGTFLAYLETDYVAIGDPPIETSVTRLMVTDSDLFWFGVSIGSVLTAGEERYTVRSVQPDGTGMSLLLLEGP